MPMRGYGIQTLTGTAVPAFGTTLAAAVAPTPDPYSGNFTPGSNPSYATVEVTAVTWFRQGDKVLVGTTDNFTAPATPNPTPPDSAKVIGIDYSANNLILQGLTRPHDSGEFIILALDVAVIIIAPGAANSGDLYIGEDSTVASASTTLIYDIGTTESAAGGRYIRDSVAGNVYDTSHYWVNGTADDTFLPAIGLV